MGERKIYRAPLQQANPKPCVCTAFEEELGSAGRFDEELGSAGESIDDVLEDDDDEGFFLALCCGSLDANCKRVRLGFLVFQNRQAPSNAQSI